MPYDFHSSVHWEGTVRFISHTTTAHHKKFKQFLTKIINGNLVRLVRVISFLQRKKKGGHQFQLRQGSESYQLPTSFRVKSIEHEIHAAIKRVETQNGNKS